MTHYIRETAFLLCSGGILLACSKRKSEQQPALGGIKALNAIPVAIAPAVLACKTCISPQKDRTRKMLPADIRQHRPGWALQGRKSAMNASHLRVYYGPQEDSAQANIAETTHEKVTVPLIEVMPLLADAVQSHRTWLRDFADDEVTISMDLYEVLLAYQHYRRPSA
jgi:hypothetical protein